LSAHFEVVKLYRFKYQEKQGGKIGITINRDSKQVGREGGREGRRDREAHVSVSSPSVCLLLCVLCSYTFSPYHPSLPPSLSAPAKSPKTRQRPSELRSS